MIELETSPKKSRWEDVASLFPPSKCTVDNKSLEEDQSDEIMCINVENLNSFSANSRQNYFSHLRPQYGITLKDYSSEFGEISQADCMSSNIEFLTYPYSMADSQGNRDELSTPVTITGFDNSSGLSADSYVSLLENDVDIIIIFIVKLM
ncbi:nuclear hormone receptor [Schistosoma japonicum]|uniref:Nuclear hormone receptor n=1 Tax=Schistosoma japonicum TaxID=6182 RepID=A0A4Z2DHB9_SCHJA|nr:nuclear hormone receptor [Schistosoma japonicum]